MTYYRIYVKRIVSFMTVYFLVLTSMSFAAQIGPGDFGTNVDRIGFDNLASSAPIILQLTMLGVHMQDEGGRHLIVVDEDSMGGNKPLSAPYAASTLTAAGPLEIFFDTPKSKVGFYLGNLSEEADLVLKAFDEQGILVDQVTGTIPDGAAKDVSAFIGLGVQNPVIRRVTFTYTNIEAVKTIDDLMLEPSHDELVSLEPYNSILLSPNAQEAEKINALNALQLIPSKKTSELLMQIAQSDPNFYIRERAIKGLEQVRDPDSIPTLVDIGLSPPDKRLMTAAYNTIWVLRKYFPMPNPPEISLTADDAIQIGKEFTVEATVTSPVNRQNVLIRFGKGVSNDSEVRGNSPIYKGPLNAGEPVVITASFLISRPVQKKIPLRVRINLNKVDATVYTVPVYIDIQEDESAISTTPFIGWEETEHILTDQND